MHFFSKESLSDFYLDFLSAQAKQAYQTLSYNDEEKSIVIKYCLLNIYYSRRYKV